MVNEFTIVKFAHVLFGMMWVGVSIYVELVLAPILKKAQTVGAYRQLLPILGRTSGFQMVSALLVIATGTVYLLLKYRQLDSVVASAPGQLVLIGLILVLVALVNGIVFLKPTAMKIVKTQWPEDPSAALPESLGPYQKRLLAGSQINALLVVVVLFLMVAAATWGP